MDSPNPHLKWGHQIARDQKPERRMGGRARAGGHRQPRGHHYHFETCAVRTVYVLRLESGKGKVGVGEGTDMRYFIHFGSKFKAKCCTCLLPSDNRALTNIVNMFYPNELTRASVADSERGNIFRLLSSAPRSVCPSVARLFTTAFTTIWLLGVL